MYLGKSILKNKLELLKVNNNLKTHIMKTSRTIYIMFNLETNLRVFAFLPTIKVDMFMNRLVIEVGPFNLFIRAARI